MPTVPRAQVTARLLLRGFDAAYQRLRPYVTDPHSLPDDAFLPLFEALNWLVVLSDLARASGDPVPVDPDDLLGLRFARNRTHHQWAMALEAKDFALPPPPRVVL